MTFPGLPKSWMKRIFQESEILQGICRKNTQKTLQLKKKWIISKPVFIKDLKILLKAMLTLILEDYWDFPMVSLEWS